MRACVKIESGQPRPANAAFVLSVKEGANLGATLAIDDGSCDVLVGTGPTCSLRLADPLVSRRHASFEISGGCLRIRDAGSTNGTFVNGTRTVEALLSGGETIRMGTTILSVERSSRDVEVSAETSFGEFVGSSIAVRRLYPLCQKVAASNVPLVIEGETGTGKEALAEAIHKAGSRANKPFTVFDCTAVPPTLLEGALFGHERGAYTGAETSRPGIFEEADGGTLLIDEIGDLDLGLQSRLLRAIQKQEVRRIGGSKWIKVDVRVIAATRRDLDAEVAAGRFRDDLFFRLAVARVHLPPLRERPEDVELLARHFWAIHTGNEDFPEHVMGRLKSYAWPGNVRELANTMARLAAFGELATSKDGELFMRRSSSSIPPAGDFIDNIVARGLTLTSARDLVVGEFERRYVQFLDSAHGDERARMSVSGVSDRYLRTLRGRARTGG
ncbi:MAG: sigma 54-interacting transcriptional regulator [Deltaproteobacteria bacterium]|nr:sigma 54-interacting transcriptional regulator [Deltaproteobacteria bacterium]